MQVLLIEDVDNLGYAGDVKKVANGYGRNYLIPQKMAVLATPGALKQAEIVRKAGEKRRAQELEDAKAIASQLTDTILVFERRAGEMGKLYGSVTPKDIADKILEEKEITIDKRKVALAEPIRQLGLHDVKIKIVMDLSINIQAEVLPEGGIAERARQEAKAAEEAKKQQAEAEKAESQTEAEDASTETTEDTPQEDADTGIVEAAADLLETASTES